MSWPQLNQQEYPTKCKKIRQQLRLARHQRKLEEVYSPIVTEVHVPSDLHHKQRPDEMLQEHIQNLTDLTKKAMGIDPANITNCVIIFLFIRNLYNRDTR